MRRVITNISDDELDSSHRPLFTELYNFSPLDERIYRLLAERETDLTVDELAELAERERTTVYRSLQRLVEAGFVRKDQHNYEGGSYCHTYRAVERGTVADHMENRLEIFYGLLKAQLYQFREQYSDLRTGAAYEPADTELTGERR